jgi:hypothetical protein
VPAIASHIAYPHPLSFFPAQHSRAQGLNLSNHLMPGHAREGESGKTAFNRKRISVANSTSLDTNSNLPGGRLDNCPLHEFQLARLRYLHCFIGSIHIFAFIFAFASSETKRSRIINYAGAEKSENGIKKLICHFRVSFTRESCLFV